MLLYPAPSDGKTEIWPDRPVWAKLRVPGAQSAGERTPMDSSTRDRRRRRSNDPLAAVHHQLDFARHEAELDALVLADTSGCLVAGAGALSECELLAAHAPLRDDEWTAPWDSDLGPGAELATRVDAGLADVEVCRLVVDGTELLLCAKGGGAERQAWMARAAAGCARILGSPT